MFNKRCEADPSALARYVLALLKKDKAIKELSQVMSDQLDVFLGPNTAPFLSSLFEAIESEEYMIAAGEPEIQSSDISDINSTEQLEINPPVIERECTPPLVIEVLFQIHIKLKFMFKNIIIFFFI